MFRLHYFSAEYGNEIAGKPIAEWRIFIGDLELPKKRLLDKVDCSSSLQQDSHPPSLAASLGYQITATHMYRTTLAATGPRKRPRQSIAVSISGSNVRMLTIIC